MSQYAIGLDLGGGSVRCLVLDLATGQITSAARSIASTPAPGTGGLGFDLDLAAASAALAAAARESMARSGAGADEVAAIACSSMRLGTVLLDASGEVLLAVPNRDARAVGPGLKLAAEHGDELQQLTGHWPLPIFGAARLRWLKETDPDRFGRTAHFLSLSDWMGYLLCGEVATEPSQAVESLLFDVSAGKWSWEWIDRLELPRALFPEIRESGSRLGALTSTAAAHFGLRQGTPVVVGGADTQCGLLGAGAVQPGDVGVIAGTTAPVQIVLDEVVIDAKARVWSGRHVVKGRWVLESNAGPVGDALDWMGRVLYPDAPLSLGGTAMLLGEAAASPPGALGLLSSLGVQVMNAKQSALPVGQLTLTHMTSAGEATPRRHLTRAIVEGIACGLRANVEQTRAIGRATADSRIYLAGGLSRSRFFAQVLADIAGEPVAVSPHPEATALGAALCAGVDAGRWPDLAAAGAQRSGEARVVSPDPDVAEASQDVYRRWQELCSEQQAADAAASRLATPFVLSAQSAEAAEGSEPPLPRILITADCDEASLAALGRLGDVEYASYRDKKRMLAGPGLVEALQGVNVFVTEIDLVDAAALEQLPDLRVVVCCRGDAVNVDADACTAFGIPMLRTPGRNADAVADLALAFLLMLARKLPEASQFLLQPGIAPGDMGKMGQAFGRFRGRELWKKTVGLIGMGAVGTKVAERLRAFGTRVLVADPYITAERAAAAGVEAVSLDDLLRESDFVSLHAAVTAETTGLLGARELAAMKPGACLVNTARAALLDEDALLEALQSGPLAGAALDTFAVEPPGSDHPLLALPNVIATPHIGGNTQEVAAHQGEIVLGELSRLIAGQAPHFAVNPSVLEAFSWHGPRKMPPADVLTRLKQGPSPAVTDLAKKEKAQKPSPAKRAEPPAAKEVAPAVESPAVLKAREIADGPRLLPPEIRAGMRAIAQAFVDGIVADDALRSFSNGRNVTLHFEIEDADCAFHFSLADGTVTGALGTPSESADVSLRMRADVLDGMFSGRANPMEAAMEGHLAFTGDAAKAMTLQHLQDDLQRLYQLARNAEGDPGDLTSLP